MPHDDAWKALDPGRRCEWTRDDCPKPAKPRSGYCAEHHALVFQKHNRDQKRSGIGPLTKESMRKAVARRKAKVGRGSA